jgi:hypothetical protein
MKMIEVQVEVSGYDSWDNKITPYIRKTNNIVEWKPNIKIGTNILEDINTRQIEKVVKIIETFEKEFNCNRCQDWGCSQCCENDNEIRARQGIFS